MSDSHEDDARSRPPLRVAVLVPGLTVASWVAAVLRDVVQSPVADLVAIVAAEAPKAPQNDSISSRLARLRRRASDALPALLFDVYAELDRRVHSVENDAFAPVDLAARLPDVPLRRALLVRDGALERLSAEGVQALRELDIDVLLRFGLDDLTGDALSVTRHGVWSFHHGDDRRFGGRPAHFWEIVEREPVTGVTLRVQAGPRDPGHVIYRSFGRTDLSSLQRSRNPNIWKGSEFVIRRLRQLHADGSNALTSLDTWNEPVVRDRRFDGTPTNAQMLAFGARHARWLARERRRVRETREQWTLAIRPRRTALPTDPGGAPFRELTVPADRFWADPFLAREAERTVLFFEEYLETPGRGRIACVELDGEGRPGPARVVLELGHHLSYPFVMRHGDEWLLVPEARSTRAVDVFRADSLEGPFTRKLRILDDVDAVDPTLFEHEGKLWLFVLLADRGGSTTDELHVYWADRLTGPWRAHRQNPVVSDIRCARPAGRIQRLDDGRLVRPAQDCSVRYGRQLALRQIQRLTPTEYREVSIGTLGPSAFPGALGVHTWAADESWEVVDLLRPLGRATLVGL